MFKNKILTVRESKKLTLNETKSLYNRYVNPGLAQSLNGFSFGQDQIVKAENFTLTTKNKRKIIDFTGGLGVLNFGHNASNILNERIKFQKEKRMEVHKNFFSQYTAALSHNLAQLFSQKLNYSFFCNSGAEAVDGAIKMAYKYHSGKRKLILHSDIAFHGKLLSSMSVSADRENTFNFPKINFGKSFKYNDIKSLKSTIKKYKSSNIFAIIIEPFSASTYKNCSNEFLNECINLGKKYDIKIIFDEIYTGFGKTGHNFYFQRYKKIHPNILILSKSFGGGKSSISGYISDNDTFKNSYGNLNDALIHTTSYNGFGEECITAIESINTLVKKKLSNKAKNIENKYLQKFKELKKNYPKKIKDIQGCGCMISLSLHKKYIKLRRVQKIIKFSILKDEKFIDKLLAGMMLDKLYKEFGILATLKYNREVLLCLEPPLTIDDKSMNKCLNAVDSILKLNLNIELGKFILRVVKRKIF